MSSLHKLAEFLRTGKNHERTFNGYFTWKPLDYNRDNPVLQEFYDLKFRFLFFMRGYNYTNAAKNFISLMQPPFLDQRSMLNKIRVVIKQYGDSTWYHFLIENHPLENADSTRSTNDWKSSVIYENRNDHVIPSIESIANEIKRNYCLFLLEVTS